MKKDISFCEVRFNPHNPAFKTLLEQNVEYVFVNGIYCNGVFLSSFGNHSTYLTTASEILNKVSLIENALNLSTMRPRGVLFWNESDIARHHETGETPYTILTNLTKALRFTRNTFSMEQVNLSEALAKCEQLVCKSNAKDLVIDLKKMGLESLDPKFDVKSFSSFRSPTLNQFIKVAMAVERLVVNCQPAIQFSPLTPIQNFESQIEVRKFLASAIDMFNNLLIEREKLGMLFVEAVNKHKNAVEEAVALCRPVTSTIAGLDQSV